MMKTNSKQVLFFALILLSFFSFGLVSNVSAKKPALSTPVYEELSRTWSDIDLLYDNYFHNSSETMEEVDRFHSLVPELIDLETIGSSYLGKDIVALRITNELRTYQKAKTLVVAHHHGREQISIEISLRFIIYLLNNYQENEQVTTFIDTQEIYIVPTINPDALDIVVNENHHWLRKNLRPFNDDGDEFVDEDPREDTNGDGIISAFDVYDNTDSENPEYLYSYFEGIDNDGDGLINEDMIGYTDLNRNYDSYWRNGRSWSDDTQSDIFPGDAPFSEPETQAFRDFALQHKFGMAYSLHSGINATFFANGPTSWAAEPELYWKMVQDYAAILPPSYTEIYFGSTKQIRPEADSNYLAGGWDTWMYEEQKTLAPITFELYRNLSSVVPEADIVIVDNSTHLIIEWREIYGYFNPTKEYINALWTDVRPGFDYLLQNTPQLEIEIEVHSGKYASGSEVEFDLEMTNPSLRIKTIDTITIGVNDETFYDTQNMISASNTLEISPSVTLPESLTNQTEVKIGNDFTGYQVFILSDPDAASTPISFTIIAVSILSCGVVTYIVKKSSHNFH